MSKEDPKSDKPVSKVSSVASVASTSSQTSTSSSGIGAGVSPNLPESAREDLPPKLTPEGLSLDPNIKMYDAIVYFIYCSEHDKIAVTNVERARCVWLPFVCLPEGITWSKASRDGVALIIGNKDAEMDAAESAKKAPIYEMSYLNVLRIQLPTEKFITRLANFVILKKSSKSTFKCCQRSARINWLRASDIIGERIDKIWGPELNTFTKLLADMNSGKHEAIVSEFAVEHSFHYLMLENSPEQKLLKASHVKAEHIVEIYEDYIEHCYPSLYMSYESFKYYLIKYGFDKNDPRLQYLFNAFSLYGYNYLDFHEVLLGIVAMEPVTKHFTEARLKFIFRYYDVSRTGFLTLDEFIVLVQDMNKSNDGNNAQLTDEQLRTKVEEAVRCVGMKDQQISLGNFLKAVLSQSFKNTENLCRSPKSILPQVSRIINTKLEEKSKSTNEGFLVSRRKTKGICFRCRAQGYEYCLHCVTFDTVGRCVEPRIICDQWVEPVANDGMNLHKYSIEYVFSTSSAPNIFIDLVKDFFHKSNLPGGSKGLMSVREDWTVFSKYLTILCEELKGLLVGEEKLLKINSPVLVIGDLHGNLHDLLIIEKNYFQSFPVVPYNIVFTGNYSGVCSHGIECVAYLFALKLCAPNKIFLLRGTNEMKSQNKKTLLHECTTKYGNDYGRKVFDVSNDIFERLPFGVIIDENVFVTHSGIPKSTKINKLNQLNRDIASVVKEAPIAYELLVNVPLGIDDSLLNINSAYKEATKSSVDSNSSTPKGKKGPKKSKNLQIGSIIGVSGFTPSENYLNSFTFDETAFDTFIRANNFTHVIRSHNLIPNDGFDLRFHNRCITVFSCSNYLQHYARNAGKGDASKNEPPNDCTIAFVDGGNTRIRVVTFDTSYEIIKPQASQSY